MGFWCQDVYLLEMNAQQINTGKVIFIEFSQRTKTIYLRGKTESNMTCNYDEDSESWGKLCMISIWNRNVKVVHSKNIGIKLVKTVLSWVLSSLEKEGYIPWYKQQTGFWMFYIEQELAVEEWIDTIGSCGWKVATML